MNAYYRLINNSKECYLKNDEKIINTEHFPEFNELNVLFIILNILYIIKRGYDIFLYLNEEYKDILKDIENKIKNNSYFFKLRTA